MAGVEGAEQSTQAREQTQAQPASAINSVSGVFRRPGLPVAEDDFTHIREHQGRWQASSGAWPVGPRTISSSTTHRPACRGGKKPIALPNGESSAFLEDGDVVTLRAWCERDGFARIGFGVCSGEVIPCNVAGGEPPQS